MNQVSTPLHTRRWTVTVDVSEHGDLTRAVATLHGDSPRLLTAVGESTRSPSDRAVPEIGDELATARALRRLAEQLLGATADDIEQVTGEEDVSLRAR